MHNNRPLVCEQTHPYPKGSESPDWTKEGPLEVDDEVWVRIALKILLIKTAVKIYFDNKKGYFPFAHPVIY
jgi:hypothetical protein